MVKTRKPLLFNGPHSRDTYKWYTAENLDEAEITYRLCAQIKPENERAHYKLGTVFSRKGEWAQAVGALRRATQLQPYWTSAWFRLAHALKKQKKTNAARKAPF